MYATYLGVTAPPSITAYMHSADPIVRAKAAGYAQFINTSWMINPNQIQTMLTALQALEKSRANATVIPTLPAGTTPGGQSSAIAPDVPNTAEFVDPLSVARGHAGTIASPGGGVILSANNAIRSPAMNQKIIARQQFARWMNQRLPRHAEKWSVSEAGLGDVWSDMKNKILGKVKDGEAKLADAAKSGYSASDIAKAAGELKLIWTNVKRADNGQPPINAVDVGGFSDMKMLVWGVIGVGALWAISRKR